MAKTIVELAKLVGVSPATVSLVYSGSPLVARKTRERVIAAGIRYGYRPNAAARAVRQGRFNRIAAVVVQYGSRGTTYAPNNGYLDTAADRLADQGYSLVFEPMHLTFDDDFIEPPSLFRELAVDGILGLPMTGYVPERLDAQLDELDAPLVWLNRKPSEYPNSVYSDEIAGGRMLARHLIELGHRRIGYLGFQGLHYTVPDRLDGVRRELAEAGLDTTHLVLGMRKGSMVDEADRLLAVDPPVTAIICYQRRAYEAALHMAADRGIRVPHDLSLCYFASAWEDSYLQYAGTYFGVPEPQMAEAGVEILLDLIEGRPCDHVPRSVCGRLHAGMTTAPPP